MYKKCLPKSTSVSYHESLEVEGIATCTHITTKEQWKPQDRKEVLNIDIYSREEM